MHPEHKPHGRTQVGVGVELRLELENLAQGKEILLVLRLASLTFGLLSGVFCIILLQIGISYQLAVLRHRVRQYVVSEPCNNSTLQSTLICHMFNLACQAHGKERLCHSACALLAAGCWWHPSSRPYPSS